MKINIKTTNFSLTPSIEDYIQKKIGSLDRYLARFNQENIDGGKEEVEVFVEVGKTSMHHHKGDVFHAEADLIVNGKQIRAEETTEDLMLSIDKVEEILKKEIVEFKERLGY